MSKVRIVFLGTPDFAVKPLECLYHDEHYEVVQVITQPDRPQGRKQELTASPVKSKALELGLPVRGVESVNTSEFLLELKALKADIAIVIAFGQIVSNEFLSTFPLGAVNIHGSLLPKWRGAAPIQRAIESGDGEIGVALQNIVQKLDAGAILGTRRIPINPEDSFFTIYEKLKNLSCELLELELMDYIRGNLTGIEQDESQVTIAKKLKKEEGEISWSRSSMEIYNQIRAFELWPGTWTFFRGKSLKVKKAKPIDKEEIFTTKEELEKAASEDASRQTESREIFGRADDQEGARDRGEIKDQGGVKEQKNLKDQSLKRSEERLGGSKECFGEIIDIKKESFLVQCKDSLLEVLEVQLEGKSKMSAGDFLRGSHLKVGDILGGIEK